MSKERHDYEVKFTNGDSTQIKSVEFIEKDKEIYKFTTFDGSNKTTLFTCPIGCVLYVINISPKPKGKISEVRCPKCSMWFDPTISQELNTFCDDVKTFYNGVMEGADLETPSKCLEVDIRITETESGCFQVGVSRSKEGEGEGNVFAESNIKEAKYRVVRELDSLLV